MCEVCRGNLQRRQNGDNMAPPWLIKGQGKWLRSNAVDLSGWGLDFQRVTHHMPGNGKKHIMWRSESMRCQVVLKTFRGTWDEDIYINYLPGGWWKRRRIEKFVNAYVQALCSKKCHTNGDRDTLQEGREGEESEGETASEISCSHWSVDKRITPRDGHSYTYDVFAAKFAGNYWTLDYEHRQRELWKYWRDECSPVVSTKAVPVVKQRRPQDAALWNKLEFKDGRLKRFCNEMSYGIIAALQQSWNLKYFGDESINLCKVIKDGSVPKYNKRIMELLTENDKAEGVMLRMSRYVVKVANRYSDRRVERPTIHSGHQVDFLESVLAMYVSAMEDGRETDFRLGPYRLDIISDEFRDASYDAFLRDQPRASRDFEILCMRTHFPPKSGDDWPNAWPIGKNASEPRFPQHCGALQ